MRRGCALLPVTVVKVRAPSARLCSHRAEQRDRQQRHAERRGQSGARRIDRLRLPDARRQHADLGRRAEQAGTPNCSAARMKTSSAPARIAGSTRGRVTRNVVAHDPGASGQRGLFQRRVHRAQRTGDQQENNWRFIERRRRRCPERIDVEQRIAPPEKTPRLIDEAGARRGKQDPGEGADQRRGDERDDATRVRSRASRHVGAHHRPGEERADDDRDRARCRRRS